MEDGRKDRLRLCLFSRDWKPITAQGQATTTTDKASKRHRERDWANIFYFNFKKGEKPMPGGTGSGRRRERGGLPLLLPSLPVGSGRGNFGFGFWLWLWLCVGWER